MKKIISTLIVLAFYANVSAQLEVDSSGDTYVSKNIYLESASNFIGTTNSVVPITFKVGNNLVGFTGSSTNGNVSLGYEALRDNAVGYGYNTAIGYYALSATIQMNGRYNSATGYWALRDNTSGSNNTASGAIALYSNTTGGGNTAIGYQALILNTTGSNNTAIGYGAYANANNRTNATAIGYGAIATANDQVVIGNTKVTSILGYNSLTIVSDGRIKKNIRAEVPGLVFVNQLQPVMYNFDLNALDELQKSDDPKINAFLDSLLMARSPEEKEIEAKARTNKEKIVYSGFIAQDVEKAAQSIGYDFSGVDAPENGKGAYGLRYAEFVVPLVKAVQELSEQNNAKDAAIASLQAQINELKEKATLRSATNETETTGMVDAVIAQCKLYQNAPNPFNQSTEIKYYLPEDVKTAYLCIYNLQGTQIKQIPIMLRGEGSQLISGSELNAGMCLYALIVDGKEVDTKRMILTK
ncbi:MAG: tail fiber domain-containing protein [Dysgonamonadaceae bacterium]|jgi:hypothetical protein|nr:tail fiber domain-containing protein [Dysgonamonadaceae bacterium]